MSKTKELEVVNLNDVEKSRLRECEEVIRLNMKSFVDVGRALTEIRDSKLYREEYGTFEVYLENRWEISRPRAYELINAHTVFKNLSAIADKLPANEGQARPLAKLDLNAQRWIWQEVLRNAPDGKITAKIVEQAVRAYLIELNGESGGGKGGGGSSNPIKIALEQIQRSLTALKDPNKQRRVLERIYQILKEELGAVDSKSGDDSPVDYKSAEDGPIDDNETIDAEFDAE